MTEESRQVFNKLKGVNFLFSRTIKKLVSSEKIIIFLHLNNIFESL